ncbi:kazrin-like [Haliotis rubra]|uniref:kazrin-like n=1 Tax=Haliotis rubra TaxID=36100 RepID=UPI001EE54AC0|nr:kazrin-like [Haliotis rubra]
MWRLHSFWGVQEEVPAPNIAFYLDNVFGEPTEACSPTETLEGMNEFASDLDPDLDPDLDSDLDPDLDTRLTAQQATELLSMPTKDSTNPFDIQNFQQMLPRLETIKETQHEKEPNSKEQADLDVESQDSPSSRNLPDVVSSSTSVCLADPLYVAADDSCHVGTRGLPVAVDVQWRASLIYISRLCTMYKLLEALYNDMCVTLRTGRRRKGQDPTSRVILQCEGSRLTGAAIQSLDSLNDQIVQYIFAQNNVDLDLEKDLSPRERETLKSSMVLIRGLLIDAQSKFRKMVDDNRQLAVKIDGSIQAANQEVNVLRAELADTNKRLSQITLTNDLKVEKATQSESDNCLRHKSDEENELTKMKEENLRLEASVKSLTREVQELKLAKAVSSDQPSYGELKLELIQTRQEVNRAKEALQAMKADRKRLKGEKLDLLNQMKQLYTTLEDKESELRDFIRNYEQRVHESDQTIKQLAMEKEECEREKWRIIKKAQEAAERAVNLRSQCDNKDQALKKLEVELAELKTNPVDPNKSSSASEADHTTHSVASTIASEELPPYETMSQSDASRDDSFSVKTSTPSHDLSVNSFTNPNKQLNTSHELPGTRHQEEAPDPSVWLLDSYVQQGETTQVHRAAAWRDLRWDVDPGHPKLALLSPDNYQEKLALVNGLKGVHMTNWKANQVLAWLEISLSMPMYGKMCAENIKSGKVLLGLSDSDLDAALGITNSIHRRKLRLAIEEQRDPGEIKYSKAANIDHTWVSHRWIPDLGLPQHAAVFESQLADGRLLNQLSKKDLEKHFNVHRKFHQASILHAVELLRLLNFDKELLTERRTQCEDNNTDPLVWSNDRVMKWIRSIELGEYVQNLRESGVHGALMVLEPSFTADTLATALGIPLSKSYLRRHIATELEAVIKPARSYLAGLKLLRAALDTPNNNTKMRINGTGSVGRSFIRSYRSASLDDGGPKSRLSFRGSLGRAFGRKIKDDLRMTFDSDVTPKSRRGIKISDPIPIQHNHSLDSIVEPDSTTV